MKKVLEMITQVPISGQLSLKMFEVGSTILIRVMSKKELEERVT